MSVNLIENILKNKSNKERALKQKAYLRNQFEFIGLTKPERAILEKEIFKSIIIKNHNELELLIKNLIAKEEREFHYIAYSIAIKNKNLWELESIKLFEYMIKTKSWWDSVDLIASNLVGGLLRKNPNLFKIMDKWIDDKNIWIRRSAIICQLKFKKETDEKRLFEYCLKSKNDNDFFIRKAIGWALREYSKTAPSAVKNFIEKNKEQLSYLSIKEGSKYL